ncbi:MAG: M20 aminoacylase family protein [Hyphomicrobiaceae bacterium]|nr:M20 aminoacylase family protein [Hyphomicrobiaceae bacterium]
MPIINRAAGMLEEVAAWRRDFHENPEVLYEVHRTAGIVADKLKAFGCDEVVPGIGRTGVVAVIKGRSSASGKVIGLRADMDALPIQETSGVPHASKIPGKMHACGHDGHTAMLLGAARYLCETRNFDGTVVLIFQPAEEGGAGGLAMVRDGMMDRWGIQEVYGLHNQPGTPVGHFALRPGPLLAATDGIDITIEGYGAHASRPHLSVDPVSVGCQLHAAFQTIVARNVDPLRSAVVSITMFQAGEAVNVIPQTARIRGTVRTLEAKVRDLVEKRVAEICTGIGAAYGAKVKLDYRRGYPVTSNHPEQTAFAAKVARDVAGPAGVDDDMRPVMGGEDFSYMLEARPGAFIFMGIGDAAGLHRPDYDFNDAAIPAGISYWGRLVEMAMPA